MSQVGCFGGFFSSISQPKVSYSYRRCGFLEIFLEFFFEEEETHTRAAHVVNTFWLREAAVA